MDNTGTPLGFRQYGDMEGGAISVLIDGLTEDGYFSDAKVFGSYAYYWFGAQLPVTEEGKLGLEYNHGSQYWRPFTYAEDTMIGSKLAARGDAIEAYFTYQLTDALSAQIRYTKIDYDYTGSNGFFGNTTGAAMKIDDVKAGAKAWAHFGNTTGAAMKIDDVKAGAKAWAQLGGTADPASAANVVGNLMASGMTQQQAVAAAEQMGQAAAFLPNIVESAQDLRFYIRYRF